MKIRYTFPVRGGFRLSSVRAHYCGDAFVEPTICENAFLIAISLTFPFPDWKEYGSTEVSKSHDGTLAITVKGLPWEDDARRIASTVEARLTPFGVDGISLDELTRECVPESAEESSGSKSMYFSISRPEVALALPKYRPGVLCAATRQRTADPGWDLLLGFYRSAWEELRRFHYIKAFFYFFFFLEGLYGESKIKTADLKRAFKSSSELVEAIRRALKVEWQATSVGDEAVNRVIEQVVDQRGFLFHNPASRKDKWSPATQGNFSKDAMLLAATASSIVLKREWPEEDQESLPSPLTVNDRETLMFERLFAQERQQRNRSRTKSDR